MTHPAHEQDVHGPCLPGYLEELNGVAVALLDDAGAVLEANRGFTRLLEETTPQHGDARSAAWLFQQPRFADLTCALADESGCVFRGPITMGSARGTPRSLNASIYRRADALLFVGEYDVVGLERVASMALGLNQELADIQRELARRNRELKRTQAELETLSRTDAMTGLPNRRHLDDRLTDEVYRLRRYGSPLCVSLVDVDHFKTINDRFGHRTGDAVLRTVARLLAQSVRRSDFVARWGGEEFALLLPETRLVGACTMLERLRQTLSDYVVPPLTAPVTASFGVSEVGAEEDGESALCRADRALYRAKREGRNRVALAR
ncbi:MAG: GGDEF domain-containing protein [Gammaproteobacteria bacterium]|nr:GGDEF domain-containing protein [Gammaproteobacteria bacterium]NIR84051.1 GGDEF domain-containing protein [Gammaproteobacteria bacterium]NIR89195.1 GGDEF domain-containing protein [Gammaproteobacteria bacterium]NIU04997.1 GGDEF domain-containing protein [Gammaproteobacteria bacterium]NIV52163.1 diguanylate cyclase [Gammaproteobacteria bacterium]